MTPIHFPKMQISASQRKEGIFFMVRSSLKSLSVFGKYASSTFKIILLQSHAELQRILSLKLVTKDYLLPEWNTSTLSKSTSVTPNNLVHKETFKYKSKCFRLYENLSQIMIMAQITLCAFKRKNFLVTFYNTVIECFQNYDHDTFLEFFCYCWFLSNLHRVNKDQVVTATTALSAFDVMNSQRRLDFISSMLSTPACSYDFCTIQCGSLSIGFSYTGVFSSVKVFC